MYSNQGTINWIPIAFAPDCLTLTPVSKCMSRSEIILMIEDGIISLGNYYSFHNSEGKTTFEFASESMGGLNPEFFATINYPSYIRG